MLAASYELSSHHRGEWPYNPGPVEANSVVSRSLLFRRRLCRASVSLDVLALLREHLCAATAKRC